MLARSPSGEDQKKGLPNSAIRDSVFEVEDFRRVLQQPRHRFMSKCLEKDIRGFFSPLRYNELKIRKNLDFLHIKIKNSIYSTAETP